RSRLQETQALSEKAVELEKRLDVCSSDLAPVFKSKVMQEMEELISAMAPSDANVLITGESGVGKEVVANVIHSKSRRAGKPLVRLNCAAFPQTMIESELFGYVKGAFTRAMNDFPGMIAEARGGTLFLDDMSEMPADVQPRFLRVLHEREWRRKRFSNVWIIRGREMCGNCKTRVSMPSSWPGTTSLGSKNCPRKFNCRRRCKRVLLLCAAAAWPVSMTWSERRFFRR